jgi:hypothetical protein
LPVIDFDNYEVSDQGRVRSLERLIRSRRNVDGSYRFRLLPARILKQVQVKPTRDGAGYRSVVTMYNDDGQKYAYTHQLVLEAFVGPRPAGKEARHLDCDPCHNQLVNLAWGTRAENVEDSRRCEAFIRGEQHGAAKLTEAEVLRIRNLRAAGISGPKLAVQFGVTPHLIYLISKKRAWKHV